MTVINAYLDALYGEIGDEGVLEELDMYVYNNGENTA